MGYYEGSWGAGEWIAMATMMLLFVGLLVWAVFSLLPRAGRSPSEDPIVLVAGRFARGEIDEGEFVRARELLRGSTSLR